MSLGIHQHLVTVWNPRYASDAMEAHLRILLDWDAKAASDRCGVDDVYVWWGKVRSNQRQQGMPHLEAILAIGAEAADDEDAARETHLYLTDYRSLYVADVTAIVTDDPRTNDADHVPSYYASSGLNCDCWFEISDIRLLVKNDLEDVAAELAKLRNSRYHDRPVSMYGGMIELPLVVTRPDGRRYFDQRERDQLTQGDLWARFDAQQGGVGALEAVLREDHLGAAAWQALDVTARRFVAMAERTMREHRRDPAADLTSVIIGYAKALEVQTNASLRTAMQKAPAPARRVKIGDSTELLPDCLPLSLGQIAHALGGEQALGQHLRSLLDGGAWFTGQYPAILDAFVSEARNPAAHGESVSRELVIEWRDRLLGVGCESLLVQLTRVKAKG